MKHRLSATVPIAVFPIDVYAVPAFRIMNSIKVVFDSPAAELSGLAVCLLGLLSPFVRLVS